MSLDLYEKLSVVGKGSYGEVWLVKQKKDNKQVSCDNFDLHYRYSKQTKRQTTLNIVVLRPIFAACFKKIVQTYF